ncbi:MAG: F0F1 ATP synthase subunit C [Erysipelotrichaceae bacterium]|nr:F0F1 ATP synthase subunit C [Erysipelotrichaceae bacterium]
MELGLVAIGAGLAVMAGMFTAIGEGNVFAKAVEAIGKNPEAEARLRSMAIVGAAITETVAIYGLLVALLIIFVLGGRV